EMNKRYVEARADVMVRLTTGYNTTKSRIYSPFDKTVETTAPPDDPAKTFPNRNIKYTITFYNPLQQPVDDMVLQDTMFGTFSYVGTISGPAPAWDVDNVVRWEGLDLTANGVISMVFEAFVPPHTLPDTCDVSHYNAVSATHALFSVPQYTGHDNNQISTGRVIVERQLKLSKSVVPTLQVPGEEVTYTIKLQNIGDSDIPYPVLLTDTLPAPFTFTAMVSDTPGDPTISGTLLIWDDIPDIPAYTEFEFSFRAEVDGITYATYKNNLAAYSPETAICPIEAAGVKIDLPFRLNKFASTTVITQGDTFSYDAEIFNIHPNRTYYVTSFEDFLPEGFTDVTDGDEHYAFDVNPPAELAPEFGSWPTGPFFVRVDGRGLGTEWCVDRALPGKDVSQTPGHVVFHISPEFEAGIANASSLAKVEVIPHVYLLQEAYPNPVAINEVQILTFTLKDNRTTPAGDITGVDLHWLSPIVGEEEFTFIESTPPPTMVVYPDYYWESLTIPAGGEAVVVLKIRAPEPLNADAKRDYSSRADVLELDDMDICIPPSYRYNLEVRRGLEILKYPTPDIVGPYGLVEYRLRVSNLTGAPVSGAVITDVLPLNWEYVDMVSGPEPISTDPPVWELPTLGPETNMEIEFNARSYVWVGPAFNEVEGRAPINIDYHKSYTNNVEVMVVSGIGFYKTVGPDTIVAGETTVYTITLYNGLEDDIKNIVITDTLPTGITFDVMLEGPEPLSIGEQLVWQIPQNLNDGRSLQLVFRVQSSPLMPNGTYYNEVEATATNAQTGSPEVIPATGPTAPLMVEGLEPVVAAKQVNPTTVRAGERVTYSITLYNESDDRTYALVVTDTLPGGLTFVGPGTPPPAQVLPGTRQRVVWSSFSIAPLETLTLTFQADVDDSLAGGTYCNDVDVAMDAFVLGYHDLACLTVTEVPRVDAQISKDDGVTRVSGGDTLTYTIRYTNAASSALPLNNVVLTETIAPLEYVTVLSTGDWVDLGGGQYRFSHPTSLTPGQSGETTFVVRLDATVPATAVLSVANQVQIGYDTVEPAIEANPDDNVAVDVDAWQGPDLVITGITVEPDEPIAGEPMYVHVTVKNQGTSPADQRHDGSYVPGVDWWLFVVELYMKEAAFVPAGAPVDVFDHLGGYCPNFACNPSRGEFLGWPDTLGVGASQELVYTLTAPDPGHYSLYAQADVTWVGWFGGQPYGLIIEAIEDNNIFIGPTVLLEDDENLLFLPLIVR
ncbi:MAG: DUF11 domain-containing protein, partial [Anaerolineae bacterium]|nr:DUF11 domain-containing protein [Anaerolineae bacterium]